MKCTKCKELAVFIKPTLCKKHFSAYIEENVFRTINKYGLLKQSDKIVVAASGGKDSLTLLNILSKKYKVNCLAVDEGIPKYRNKTLRALKVFCRKRRIKLEIVSFLDEFGGRLDSFLDGKSKPCSACGTLRRYLMNKYSKKHDVVCTGHNLDDEAQAVLMNIIRSNANLSASSGPASGIIFHNGFVRKVKPLYFLKEKEIMTYAFLNNLLDEYQECPNAVLSYRAKIRDMLNKYADMHPETKRNVIKFFLKNKQHISLQADVSEIRQCRMCGEPAKGDVCNACRIVSKKNT